MMLDEAELMRRTAAGDGEAFRILVERYGTAIHTFFMRLVRNREDAEDLTQELFLALFRASGRYRPDAPFSAYLYRIASNLAASHLRRRSIRSTQSVDELAATGLEIASGRVDERPDTSLEGREMRRRYEEALGRLPSDWRIALELRVGRELSYREIAEAMGKSVAAIESILVRARERIAAEMGEGKQSRS
jgi:RNA polymerase sigma-70 factor (ECF subfamily)